MSSHDIGDIVGIIQRMGDFCYLGNSWWRTGGMGRDHVAEPNLATVTFKKEETANWGQERHKLNKKKNYIPKTSYIVVTSRLVFRVTWRTSQV